MARKGGCEFQMPQEQLAEMLDVGRTLVTRVLRQFCEQGVIETRRGVFRVNDARALRKKSCSCTAAIEDHFDTVLHGV